jgi:hypothetical protein
MLLFVRIEFLENYCYMDSTPFDQLLLDEEPRYLNAPTAIKDSADYKYCKQKGDIVEVEVDEQREKDDPQFGKVWLKDLATGDSFPTGQSVFRKL